MAACLLLVSSLGAGCTATAPVAPGGGERVVLVHGLARGPASLWVLSQELEENGYEVVALEYPSTEQGFDELVVHVARELDRCCPDGETRTHFVSHSLGGILVRALLEIRPREDLGRVVMLAPPNGGSELADALGENWFAELILGPVVAELGTSPDSAPNRLGPPSFEVGVLTGNRSWNPIGSLLIPGPDDGTVAVERARVESMADFRVLPATHTFLMNRADVAMEVQHFLRYGRFSTQ